VKPIIRWTLIFFVALAGGWSCLSQGVGPRSGEDETASRIVGVWRGNSVCMMKGSPCHDEVNVYRFSSVAGRPNAFSVTASKVVDGKEIVMGRGEWTYDPGNHLVECKAPAILLTIAGDKMEGALSLTDGTAYRRIYLKKEN
jgi:hypothetical protein